MNEKRESFGSRLGFLLVSAGCAIGIGNVWRFPYVVGENGGGLFVLLYLAFLLIMGVPALVMELAVGRAGRASMIPAYRKLEPKGSKWHLHGVVAMVGNYLLMMYYTTVAGWMLGYFIKFAAGRFDGLVPGETDAVFNAMLANPAEMTLWMAIIVIGGFFVVSFGLQNGLERVTKVMMSALLLLIVVLVVHSFTLEKAAEGLSFYLLPNLNAAREIGIGNVLTAAMNQAFFTLSIGIGSMEIFGSYMSREYTLMSESVRISLLDTFVALMSGMIIFPACFSYNVQPDAGPSLIFITLPNVFVSMTGGRIWGALFFMFMTFASFSTVIAVFENLLAHCMDNFGWERKKAVVINAVFILLASLPCVLGYNVWSGLRLIGGRDVLDTEDFIVSNLLLPIGTLIFVLFCTTKWGWGMDKFLAEANEGKGTKLPKTAWLKVYFRFVLPIMVLIILIQGLR